MGIEQVSQNRKDYYGIGVGDAKSIPAGELYVINSRGGILPMLTFVCPSLKLLIIKEDEDGKV